MNVALVESNELLEDKEAEIEKLKKEHAEKFMVQEEILASKNEKITILEDKVVTFERMEVKMKDVEKKEKLSRTEANAGCMFKMHFDEIESLIIRALNNENLAYETTKGLRNWKEKLGKTQDYEKAKKFMNLTSLFEMLLEIFLFEVLWEEIAGDMDAARSEVKLISEFHDETMDKLKMRKKK